MDTANVRDALTLPSHGDQMAVVVSNTRFLMEDRDNVTPLPMQMGKAHAAPRQGGVETVMDTANVQDALTSDSMVRTNIQDSSRYYGHIPQFLGTPVGIRYYMVIFGF